MFINFVRLPAATVPCFVYGFADNLLHVTNDKYDIHGYTWPPFTCTSPPRMRLQQIFIQSTLLKFAPSTESLNWHRSHLEARNLPI